MMNERTLVGEDRGVSEVIAFVLVFAIIIGSVGVLYMVGFQSIESYQESEQLRNAERAMEVLGQNVDDLQRNGGIEERQSELALQGGSVTVTGDSGMELEIQVDGTVVETVRPGSITYRDGNSLIAYEAGGIFRGVEHEPDQSVVLAQPRFTCGDERAVLSLIAIDDGVEERTIAGDDVGEVTVIHQETNVTREAGSSMNVEVEASDSAFDAGWNYTLDHGNWDDGDCDPVDTVIVRIVTVDVEL